MKTLTKLTLATMAALTFGTTSLLAGPGPISPTHRPARQTPPAMAQKCDRMTVHQNPKQGGTSVVACNKAIKDTLACRLACR